MPSTTVTRTPAQRAATWLLLAAFGVLTLISAVQGYLSRRASGEVTRVGDALVLGLAGWVTWLLLAPAIIALGRRFDFARGRRLQSAVIHLLALGATYVVSILTLIWLSLLYFNPSEQVTWEIVSRTLLGSARLSLAIFTYVGIIAVDRVLRIREALRAQELQATRLQGQATQARLDALAARLEPHFLFNALQSVSALIDRDPPRARTMLAQIGDLLRDALAAPESGEVTLREEMQLLSRYLAIEETRFADRLHVEVVVAPDAEAVMVPRFVLQPVVENALRHGLAPLPEGGRLRITATRADGRLRLVVWNDGVPLAEVPRSGLGVATTRERLAARHGEAASLLLRPAAGGGVETVIELPA
ncbi:MAG: histidine kinase [Gemmatimonadales bacterium]|nr:histidine kinase [Gemmatimonadales bacterium]